MGTKKSTFRLKEVTTTKKFGCHKCEFDEDPSMDYCPSSALNGCTGLDVVDGKALVWEYAEVESGN